MITPKIWFDTAYVRAFGFRLSEVQLSKYSRRAELFWTGGLASWSCIVMLNTRDSEVEVSCQPQIESWQGQAWSIGLEWTSDV